MSYTITGAKLDVAGPYEHIESTDQETFGALWESLMRMKMALTLEAEIMLM